MRRGDKTGVVIVGVWGLGFGFGGLGLGVWDLDDEFFNWAHVFVAVAKKGGVTFFLGGYLWSKDINIHQRNKWPMIERTGFVEKIVRTISMLLVPIQ